MDRNRTCLVLPARSAFVVALDASATGPPAPIIELAIWAATAGWMQAAPHGPRPWVGR